VRRRRRTCTDSRYRQGGWIDETIKANKRETSRVRAKVEHSSAWLSESSASSQVRYRGLAKNLHRLAVTAALANLLMVRRQLLRLQG